MANVESKNHLYILQTGEIPVDGDLSNVMVQLCHQYSIVDTEAGQVLGKSQGEGILNVGTPAELELEFPGFAEKMEWIKVALVTKAMQIISSRKAAELAAIEASNNPDLML